MGKFNVGLSHELGISSLANPEHSWLDFPALRPTSILHYNLSKNQIHNPLFCTHSIPLWAKVAI